MGERRWEVVVPKALCPFQEQSPRTLRQKENQREKWKGRGTGLVLRKYDHDLRKQNPLSERSSAASHNSCHSSWCPSGRREPRERVLAGTQLACPPAASRSRCQAGCSGAGEKVAVRVGTVTRWAHIPQPNRELTGPGSGAAQPSPPGFHPSAVHTRRPP